MSSEDGYRDENPANLKILGQQWRRLHFLRIPRWADTVKDQSPEWLRDLWSWVILSQQPNHSWEHDWSIAYGAGSIRSLACSYTKDFTFLASSTLPVNCQQEWDEWDAICTPYLISTSHQLSIKTQHIRPQILNSLITT